jgi:transcriptional regulator with XRE-family HTH domain
MRRTDDFTSATAQTTLTGLGNRLRVARKARNWTLNQLEERVRVHRTTLARLERGDVSVSLAVLVRVLEALGQLSDLELVVRHPEAHGKPVAAGGEPVLPNDF